MATKKTDNFYEGMGAERLKPSLSCGSMVFFLAIIFLMLSYIVWWLVGQVKTKVATSKPTISQISLDGAEGKLQTFLGGSKKQSGQVVTITLTEGELSSLLFKNQILAESNSLSLSDPQATIDPEHVTISGFLTKPIKSHLTIIGRPTVSDGRLAFDIEKVNAGKLGVPSFLQGSIESLTNRLLTDRLNDPHIEYQTAVLGQQVLTLTGKTK